MARAPSVWTCWLAVIASVGVWIYTGVRVLIASPVTLPHQVAWQQADGTPMGFASPRDRSPCSSDGDDFMLVLGGRAIVPCHDGRTGWAAIAPAAGTATFAWPLPETMRSPQVVAVAPRDDGSFGVAFETGVGDRSQLAIGLAGPSGWVVEPAVVANRDNGSDFAEVLAMAWSGRAVEAVVTSPVPGFGNDPFGMQTAPVIVRVAPGAPIARTTAALPPACDCTLRGALHDKAGWRLVASQAVPPDGGDERVVVVSATGDIAAAPRELAWWSETSLGLVDRSALGVVSDSYTSEVVAPDGTRQELAATYGTPLDRAFELGPDGVLRHARIGYDNSVVRAIVGGRAVTLDTRGDVLELDRAPIARDGWFGFHAAFVPAAGGGTYLVGRDGAYVTLDADLHRTDALALTEHLRTRGSSAPFVDEPMHVTWMWVALLGLPCLLLFGWLAARATGARDGDAVPAAIVRGHARFVYGRLLAACAIYLAIAYVALSDLLPKL